MADAPHGLASLSSNGTVFQPLKSVAVRATIVDTSAHVVVTQTFANNGLSDARYIFPTPANAAVCAFEMRTSGGRVVHARVKDLDKAKDEFQAAPTEDKWAGLLQEVAADAFVMSLGAIPAGQDVTIVITYVQDLPQDDLVKQVRFTFPTRVVERYGPVAAALQGEASTSERAALSIVVDVTMTSPIERIHSPTHAIKTTLPSGQLSSALVELLDATTTILRKDFVLSIQAEDVAQPRCVAEVDERRQSVALSLTLVPNLGLRTIPEQEYVFLLDRSGSMQEDDRIVFAKAALQMFLRSLPAQDTLFNIVSFGSHSVPMWPYSRRYVPTTLDFATVQVDAMDADMGGTEIHGALREAIFACSRTVPTSIFVLTDGKIWHTDRVLAFVRSEVAAAGQPDNLRVFTLGVGDGASTALCEGLARVGNGICLMASSSNDIASKCASLLKAARVASSGNLQGITVDWGHHSSATVQQAPSGLPDVYPDNRLSVSAILTQATSVPSHVALHGRTPDGREVNVPVPVRTVSQSVRLLHVLAARRLITELEDVLLPTLGDHVAERLKRASVVRLSEEYQLASIFAAFVAVDEGEGESDHEALESVHDDAPGGEKDDSESASEADSEASYKTAESSPRDDDDVSNTGQSDTGQGAADGVNGDASGTYEETSSTGQPNGTSAGTPASRPPAYAVVPSRQARFRAARDSTIMFIANSFVQYVPPLEDFIEIFALSGPARPIPLTQVFRRPGGRRSPPRIIQRPSAARFVPANDPVTGVARLQAHDGSFAFSPALVALITGDDPAFEERCRKAQPPDVNDVVWGTAIVLAFLKTKQAARRAVWENLWVKALDFGSLRCQGGRAAFVMLIDQAEAVL